MSLCYACNIIVIVLHKCFTIIAQVTINFLPVGHAHEDVDQFFSRMSSQLRENGAESIPGK